MRDRNVNVIKVKGKRLFGIKESGFKERYVESSFRLMKPYPVRKTFPVSESSTWN